MASGRKALAGVASSKMANQSSSTASIVVDHDIDPTTGICIDSVDSIGTGMTKSATNNASITIRDPSDVEEPLSYPALAWYVTAHLVVLIFAIPFASRQAIICALILHTLFGGTITLGVHRYFSHFTFRAPRWLHFLLALGYTLSFDRCGQGLISWVAAHKFHHAYSDRELDPHSPAFGFWHSFCGHHLFRRRHVWEFDRYKRYCPELASDPMLVWFDRPRNIWMLQFFYAVFLFTWGGVRGPAAGFDWWMAQSFLVWGIFVRYVFTQTLHSFLDTLNHGIPPFHHLPDTYGTNTLSKNNMVMWLFQLGNETWHNVHHAFPRAANNGGRWYRWDVDSILMKCMERLGIVSGCSWITEDDLQRRKLHTVTKKAKRAADDSNRRAA
jgi:fatty-acid desaturase